MVLPKIMKIHKNLPGHIPNVFQYQNIILSLRNCIHNNFLYGGHPNGTPQDYENSQKPSLHLMISQSTNKQTHIHFYIYR